MKKMVSIIPASEGLPKTAAEDRSRLTTGCPPAPTIALFLALLLTACGPVPLPASTSTPAGVPPPATAEPIFTPIQPTATKAWEPTLSATGLPPAGLSPQGPWLLLNTDQGLWVANPDGTGAALIQKTGPVLIPGSLQHAVSSAGGHIAFLTYSGVPEGYSNYRNLTINFLSLPQTQSWISIPLTSPATEPSGEFPSDIMRAMVEHTSYAWSPDGKRLAYISAAEGPSADLYEYTPEAGGNALRLTDGPDQAFGPVWSPDGMWIVQGAAAGFGTGAGLSMTGMFAARADDSGVISLYDIPKNSGGEDSLGWLNDHTLVSRSWYITCGPSDLRLTDLSVKESGVVFKGCISAAAVATGIGNVLFAQSPGMAQFEDNPRPGVYILIEADRRPRLISNLDFQEIVWSAGAGRYLARTAGGELFSVTANGDVFHLLDQVPQIPTVSPDGRSWAWAAPAASGSGTELWIGAFGKDARAAYPGIGMRSNFLWTPDGQSIYFLGSDGGLYRLQAPDWDITAVAGNLKPGGAESVLAWVRG